MRPVGVLEQPPPAQRNPHRFEVAGRHHAVIGAPGYIRTRRHTLGREAAAAALPSQGQCAGETGGPHAGQRAHALQHALEERRALRKLAVLGHWRIHAHSENMVRAEARIDTAQPGEAFEQQSGPHQQHQGERHFADHQQIAQHPAAGTGAAASTLFQHHVQIDPRDLQGRRHAEQQTAGE